MNLISPKGCSVAVRTSVATLVAIATVMLLPSIGSAAPVAKISASRASGPAPLAVFFDATGTTDSNVAVEPFRELGYRFTFGDASSGSWTYSGRPKNEQIGAPLAAHVFETPGTYTVQVTAKDAAGATSNASVVITVQSADSTFSGTKTVCLSTGADFTGCPSGAQQIANATSWPLFQSGYRYLLHRGQDFNSFGALNFGTSSKGLIDSQLGAFGTGNKPSVGTLTVQSGTIPDTTWNKRNVVMDLDAVSISQYIAGVDLLVFRNTITRGGTIKIADTYGWWIQNSTISGWPNPENIFVIENEIDDNYAANSYGITGNAMRFAIMGNSIDRTYYHNVRVWQAYKSIIAHNNLTARLGTSAWHALKVHASGIGSIATLLPVGSALAQRSSQITIADNKLGSSSSNVNWLAASEPQNDQLAEGIEYLIWEDNRFQHGSNYGLDISWAGRQLTERGNTNITDNKSTSVSVGHSASLPADWNGPYFPGQASMKLRFTGTEVQPLPPSMISVQ